MASAALFHAEKVQSDRAIAPTTRGQFDVGEMNASHASNISEREMKHLGGLYGRTFPDSEAELKERDVAERVASALVVDFAHYRSHHKVIARIAGASPKSAENWLAGEHPPSLIYFLRLLPHSPSLRKLVAMESDLSPQFAQELSALIQRHMRGA